MPDDSPHTVFIEALNRLKCPYMVTGSVAATLYGEPRFTLEFHREGGSEKHIADCRAIFALAADLNRAWLDSAARERGLSELLHRVAASP